MNVRLAMILGLAGVSLVGCGSLDRSMLFFTHTTVGIEVSAGDPTNGAPIKAVVGYKRAEGVINPVYDKAGIAGIAGEGKYRKEAYSVLAKIQGKGWGNRPEMTTETGGNIGAKIKGSQWFATGEAAKILASQPGIAGAISGSPDIAEAEAKIRGIAQGIPTGDHPIRIAAIRLAHERLKSAAGSSTEARHLKQRLDKAASSLSGNMPFTQYQYDKVKKAIEPLKQLKYQDSDRFKNVLSHWSKLDSSIKDLTRFVSHWQAQNKRPDDYDEKKQILACQTQDRESFLKDWGNRREVVQLIEWFIADLKGEK